MRIIVFLLASILMLFPALAHSQDDIFVVSDFSLAKGMGMDASFVNANMPVLRIVADRMARNPRLQAHVYAWADATRFGKNHDQLNASTALSRYNLIVGILVDSLGVDPSRISPAYTRESSIKGGEYRKVEIRLVEQPEYATRAALDSLRNELCSEIDACRGSDTYLTNVYNFFSLVELGIGVSSHVYGDAIPLLHGRLGNPTISFEASVGNSIFKRDETHLDQRLRVQYTFLGLHLRYHPSWELPIDLIGGWERLEARSASYGRYVAKSEGPVIGAVWQLWRHVRLAGFWTPAEEDKLGTDFVSWKQDRFRVEVVITKLWEK